MKRFFFISCVLLMCSATIFGQTAKSDLEQLKKEINLPASVSISTADVSFPESNPVKIYLAIKHNKSSAKDFSRWVEQWNKSKAAQFGEIQIVDNLMDADVAAVQYQFGVGSTVREDSVLLRTGKIPDAARRDDANESDRMVLTGIGNSKVRGEVAAITLKIPIYSYLLVRGQNSEWFVDYSRLDDRLSEESFPERFLKSALEDKLRNR